MTAKDSSVGGAVNLDQGPAELVQMASVARYYYLQGLSKVQIADDLGISRFKVARILEAARDSGLVQISIGQVDGLDLDVSAQLRERFGLHHCAVLAIGEAPNTEVLDAVGATAARLMSDLLTSDDVLGLPWSRSVLAMTQHMRDLEVSRVVQLTGALELPGTDATAVDIVRAAARAAGSGASIFHAPFVLEDAASAQALRGDGSVAEGLEAVSQVTHAAVGVGGWGPGLSTIYDVATEQERARLRSEGAVGEVAGVPFDAQGRPVGDDLLARLVTLSPAQLRAIPVVTALTYGAGKAPAVRAALKGGLITNLVTDRALAEVLLSG